MCIIEQNTMNFNCSFVLMVSRDYWYYMVLQMNVKLTVFSGRLIIMWRFFLNVISTYVLQNTMNVKLTVVLCSWYLTIRHILTVITDFCCI